jgi:hypothetical protein
VDVRQRATPGLVPAPIVSGGTHGGDDAPDDATSASPVRETTEGHRALAAICPYLLAEDGTWRAAEPMREHRCTAVRPPAPLSDDTQRRLCLAEAHVTCPDYLSARQRRASELARDRIAIGQLDTLRFQPTVRAAPIVLERPERGGAARMPRMRSRGLTGRGPVPLVVAALVLLVLVAAMAAFALPRSGAPGTTASPRGSVPAVAMPSPSRSASPVSSARPTTSAGASRSPAAVSPSAGTSIRTVNYRVKAGDSLRKIALAFDTTVAVLKQLNGIKDPPRIRRGQVLKVPAPAE